MSMVSQIYDFARSQMQIQIVLVTHDHQIKSE